MRLLGFWICEREPAWAKAVRLRAEAAAAALAAPSPEDLAAWEAQAKADLETVREDLHAEGLLMAQQPRKGGAPQAGCCAPQQSSDGM